MHLESAKYIFTKNNDLDVKSSLARLGIGLLILLKNNVIKDNLSKRKSIICVYFEIDIRRIRRLFGGKFFRELYYVQWLENQDFLMHTDQCDYLTFTR